MGERVTDATHRARDRGDREMREPIDQERRRFLGGAAAALAAAGLGMIGSAMPRRARAAVGLPVAGAIPSLSGATDWLNSPPLTPASLRGRVTLIDFWTYTCVNW